MLSAASGCSVDSVDVDGMRILDGIVTGCSVDSLDVVVAERDSDIAVVGSARLLEKHGGSGCGMYLVDLTLRGRQVSDDVVATSGIISCMRIP